MPYFVINLVKIHRQGSKVSKNVLNIFTLCQKSSKMFKSSKNSTYDDIPLRVRFKGKTVGTKNKKIHCGSILKALLNAFSIPFMTIFCGSPIFCEFPRKELKNPWVIIVSLIVLNFHVLKSKDPFGLKRRTTILA